MEAVESRQGRPRHFISAAEEPDEESPRDRNHSCDLRANLRGKE